MEADRQGTRIVLEGKDEFAEAVVRVSARASRGIAIFTPDLESGVYDSPRLSLQRQQGDCLRHYYEVPDMQRDPNLSGPPP